MTAPCRIAGTGLLAMSLLAVAGLGYAVDGAGFTTGLAAFTFVGEVTFMVWLLVKGGNASTPKDRHSLAGAARP